MYKEWYAAEIFAQNFPIQNWVTGEMVWSTNQYFAGVLIINLSQSNKTEVKMTFFYPNEPAMDYEFTIQPGCQGRLFLGGDYPVLIPGLNLSKRFGLRIQSTESVVAQATLWERLPNDPISNSMSTFMLHPGPLGKAEKGWCCVDSITLRNDKPLEEREWFTILNPNNQTASCILRFYPGARIDPQSHATMLNPEQLNLVDFPVSIPAESIFSILQSDIPGVQPNKAYSLIASSDLPIVLQGVRQIYTRGNNQAMRDFAVLDAMPVGHVDIK